MGKGKGKAGRKTEKAAARAARKEKLPGVPKPAKPLKKEKVKKPKTVNPNPPGSESFSIPMGQSKPLTKTPQHVKWPALFKKHLGVIEAHIRSLDRAMQSMKSQMGGLDEKERLEWELGETGNWRVICEMMDRAREVLANARKCADGILPSRSLKDKKGLGVRGTTFEPLGPKLAARAKEMGYEQRPDTPKHATSDADSDGDSGMSDVSDDLDDSESLDGSSPSLDSDSESPVETNAEFVPVTVVKKADKSGERKESVVEPNPYFVVDTKPTPVNLNGHGAEKKKSKKRAKDDEAEPQAKKTKKARKSQTEAVAVVEEPPVAPNEPSIPTRAQVDFNMIEAQLQAEVQAGLKAQQEEEARNAAEAEKAAKKEKKKRKRSSGGDSISEEVVEKKVKKEKIEKKENKRKVDDSANGDEVDGAKKKKRKHKLDSDSD